MNRPVPLRKAVSIVLAGFICGFCAVAAYLSYSNNHRFTTGMVGLVGGSVLALVGAIALNRFL